MAATLKSLAARLNLSHTTVAKILNNDPTFRTTPETRRRVHALAEELGYRPTVAARHLLQGGTRHIGLLLHDLHDPFFAVMAHGVERAVAAAGYSLVLGLHPAAGQDPSPRIDPVSWYVDGLIIGLFGYYPPGAFARWNRRMPVVAIGNARYGDSGYPGVAENAVPYVDFDQYAGSRAVGRHLAEQGCRRIAYFGWPDARRRDGLRDGVQETSGGVVEEILLPDIGIDRLSDTGYEAVCEAMERRLASPDPFPDGLFCYNDMVAGLVFGVLRRHGLRIPEDVCLTGFNDDLDSRYREVPLTSVAVPMEQMCRRAVESVVFRLRGEPIADTAELLAPTLIVRQSSRRRL